MPCLPSCVVEPRCIDALPTAERDQHRIKAKKAWYLTTPLMRRKIATKNNGHYVLRKYV